MNMMLTAERLRHLFSYNPDTGVFTRRISLSNRVKVGEEIVGSPNEKGYLRFHVDGWLYKAHRLAWLYVHGEWPDQLDHINGDKADNRIANLRLATTKQNHGNRPKNRNNTTGYKGVHLHDKNGRLAKPFVATIYVNGRGIHLGMFATAEAAHAAYVAAAQKHFGEFAHS